MSGPHNARNPLLIQLKDTHGDYGPESHSKWIVQCTCHLESRTNNTSVAHSQPLRRIWQGNILEAQTCHCPCQIWWGWPLTGKYDHVWPTQLVLESPVRSSYWAPGSFNRDRDQLALSQKLKITGPDHCKPVIGWLAVVSPWLYNWLKPVMVTTSY